MLYVIPAPVGAVTVIVPVAVVHDGCDVTDAVGAGKVAGSVMVIEEEAAGQLLASFTYTV